MKTDLPCRDCITKVICRNELLNEINKYDHIPHISSLVGRTIRRKCVLVDRFLHISCTKGKFYNGCKKVFYTLGLLKLENLKLKMNRIIRLEYRLNKLKKERRNEK